MHAGNGSAPLASTALEVVDVREQSPLQAYLESSAKTAGRIVDELTDLRNAEQALADELQRQSGEARARCANYQRAMDALGARKRTPAAKAKPKAAAKGPQPISDAKIAEVEQAVRKLMPKSPHKVGSVPAITAGFINDNSDFPHETARRALNALREREVLRVAGTGKGGGVLFALMPEGNSAD